MVYILNDPHLYGGDSFGIIGLIDNYKSLIINDQYYGQGYVELKAPATPDNIQLLWPGRYIVREKDRDGSIYKRVMAIQDINITTDADEGNIIIATGVSLKSEILRRRIVNQRTFVSGNAKTCLGSVIRDNCINASDSNRNISNLYMEWGFDSTSSTMDTQLLGENIAEWMESITQTYGWGWDMYINSIEYRLKVYQGENRTTDQYENMPIVFSREYDNLYNSDYNRFTSNYTNVAYIFGEDTPDGLSRKNTIYNTDSSYNKGLRRYERFVDSSMTTAEGETTISDSQYYKNLRALAKQEMDAVKLYEFGATTAPDGIFVINKDYFLGDLVNIETEYGLKAKARIIEIIYSEDENGETVVPGFSEWEVA